MTDLLSTTDAMVWAEEFCKENCNATVVTSDTDRYGYEGDLIDEGTLVGWFANAMAIAYREGAQSYCPHDGPAYLAGGLSVCNDCGKLL